ncbi:MAG: phosphohydrolase [Hyphomicrobiales bacterium]|nr:MAG: phosphohydrolase [Hyphomicrobiales bacterium]
MSDTLLITRALTFAAEVHTDQRRKGARAEPYINHLIEVATLVASATGGTDPELVVAALLHDTVEDTDTTIGHIAEHFGDDVAGIVEAMTDDKSLPKMVRKARQIEKAPGLDPRAKMVKIADKVSNLTSLLESPPDQWPHERIHAYAQWAEAVVAGCRGVSADLEQRFDAALQDVLARYPGAES